MEMQESRGDAGLMTSKVICRYHVKSSDAWLSIGSYDANTGEGLLPLAIDAAYVLHRTDGR